MALNLRAADAAEMVRRGAKTLHLELEGESYDGVSQNVCAEIPGTDPSPGDHLLRRALRQRVFFLRRVR